METDDFDELDDDELTDGDGLRGRRHGEAVTSKRKSSDLFAGKWLRAPATNCRRTASCSARRPSTFARPLIFKSLWADFALGVPRSSSTCF